MNRLLGGLLFLTWVGCIFAADSYAATNATIVANERGDLMEMLPTQLREVVQSKGVGLDQLDQSGEMTGGEISELLKKSYRIPRQLFPGVSEFSDPSNVSRAICRRQSSIYFIRKIRDADLFAAIPLRSRMRAMQDDWVSLCFTRWGERNDLRRDDDKDISDVQLALEGLLLEYLGASVKMDEPVAAGSGDYYDAHGVIVSKEGYRREVNAKMSRGAICLRVRLTPLDLVEGLSPSPMIIDSAPDVIPPVMFPVATNRTPSSNRRTGLE